MKWLLEKLTDLDTGETVSCFTFADDKNKIQVPENAALLLVKQMLRHYPEAVDALVAQINQEDGIASPGGVLASPTEEEQLMDTSMFEPQPSRTAPQQQPAPQRQQQQGSPLQLPDQPNEPTLSDFAYPKGERDTPQI